MHIILTGKTGIGKTTVCEKVIAMAEHHGHSCGGFLTAKCERGIIITDIRTGEKKPLAGLTDIYGGPRTWRYFFNPEGIEFGNRALSGGVTSEILFVDEIGHLELRGEGFAGAIEMVGTESVRNSIVVIRKKLLPEFLPRLCRGITVIETTRSNRDTLPQKIYNLLRLSNAAIHPNYDRTSAG